MKTPLERISAVSNELADAMADIVWAINPKKDSWRELVLQMRRFASDVLSAVLSARVISLFREFRPPERVDYDLTGHEIRILKLLVDGYNFTTAAKKLGVCYNAVKFHMTRIYDKLQVHSKTDAVVKALQNRLLD